MWSTILNSEMNWNKAKKYCANYNGSGHSNWRLPTLDELKRANKNKNALGITDQEIWAEKHNKPAYFNFERRGHPKSGVPPDFSLNVLCIAD